MLIHIPKVFLSMSMAVRCVLSVMVVFFTCFVLQVCRADADACGYFSHSHSRGCYYFSGKMYSKPLCGLEEGETEAKVSLSLAYGSWTSLEESIITNVEYYSAFCDSSGLKYSLDGQGENTSGEFSVYNNGMYTVTVTDSAGKSCSASIEVTNIDNKKPVIGSVSLSKSVNGGPVTVSVDAYDGESGLAANPYSFDGGHTFQAGNTYTVNSNCTLEIVVIDAAYNTEYSSASVTDIVPPPTPLPTAAPTGKPTPLPTLTPTMKPTNPPSATPSKKPAASLPAVPMAVLVTEPAVLPTVTPSAFDNKVKDPEKSRSENEPASTPMISDSTMNPEAKLTAEHKSTATPKAEVTSEPETKATAAPKTKATAAPKTKATAAPKTKATEAPKAKATAKRQTKETADSKTKETKKSDSGSKKKMNANHAAGPTSTPNEKTNGAKVNITNEREYTEQELRTAAPYRNSNEDSSVNVMRDKDAGSSNSAVNITPKNRTEISLKIVNITPTPAREPTSATVNIKQENGTENNENTVESDGTINMMSFLKQFVSIDENINGRGNGVAKESDGEKIEKDSDFVENDATETEIYEMSAVDDSLDETDNLSDNFDNRINCSSNAEECVQTSDGRNVKICDYVLVGLGMIFLTALVVLLLSSYFVYELRGTKKRIICLAGFRKHRSCINIYVSSQRLVEGRRYYLYRVPLKCKNRNYEVKVCMGGKGGDSSLLRGNSFVYSKE